MIYQSPLKYINHAMGIDDLSDECNLSRVCFLGYTCSGGTRVSTRAGVPGHLPELGYPCNYPSWGTRVITRAWVPEWGYPGIYPSWGTRGIYPSWGTWVSTRAWVPGKYPSRGTWASTRGAVPGVSTRAGVPGHIYPSVGTREIPEWGYLGIYPSWGTWGIYPSWGTRAYLPEQDKNSQVGYPTTKLTARPL